MKSGNTARVRPGEQPIFLTVPSENPPCPVCQETKRAYLFVVHDFRIVRCPGCGLLSQDQISTADGARALQAGDITEQQAALLYLRALKDRGVQRGKLLLLAAREHPAHAQAIAEGFEVTHCSSTEEIASEGPYDAALILHQLEKSSDPLKVLSAVHTAIKPDGLLLLSTLSIDSWPAHFFGSQWTEWRSENRFYFDRITIQSMLMRSGFRDIWIEPEKRSYTLQHIYERAVAYPQTYLTRMIIHFYRIIPSTLHHRRIRLTASSIMLTAKSAPLRERPLCSVIVPAYNEAKTFTQLMDSLLEKRIPEMDKQVIVVESNSTDGTRELALRYASHPEVKLVLQEKPKGKGNAVRDGFRYAEGDVILIQDADLEYELNDYDVLLERLLMFRSLFVLGTRHRGDWKMRKFGEQHWLAAIMNLAHIFFRTLINVLYRQQMSDPFTMFKVFYRECLYGLRFECNRFNFDHELVIKLVRKGYSPFEVPVNYCSRSFQEGKKIQFFRDPITWLYADIKYRFVSPFFCPWKTGSEK